MKEKLRALLGFARKSGRLAVGTAATEESIKRRGSNLVIIGCDISEKSQKEIRFLGDKFNVPVAVTELTMYDITQSIGTKAGILSVEDEGFAKALSENL